MYYSQYLDTPLLVSLFSILISSSFYYHVLRHSLYSQNVMVPGSKSPKKKDLGLSLLFLTRGQEVHTVPALGI